MKKIILTLLTTALIGGNIYAQDDAMDSRDRLTLGVKAGVNYSNVYDAQGQDFVANPKLGFACGAFLTIPIGKYLGVQPEVLFSQKGFQATGSILGSSYNLTRTTDYLDIPILFSLKPSEFLTLLAGPQFSYLLKQTDVFANESTSIQQETVFENDNVRKNTFCLTGGFDINIGRVVFGARVGWDVLDNNGDGTSTTPRYKNVWYQGTLGIRLF
jgi:hypothetical protein